MNKIELITIEENVSKLFFKYGSENLLENNDLVFRYWREFDTHVLETYPLNPGELTNLESITRAARKIRNPKQDGALNLDHQREVVDYVRL